VGTAGIAAYLPDDPAFLDLRLVVTDDSLKLLVSAAVDKPLRIAVTALAADTIGLMAIIAFLNF
jgi:hypothetical protein